MPKTAAYDLALLKKVADAWNGDESKRVIAARWGRSPGWLDDRLAEARAAGLNVKPPRVPVGTITAYSQEQLDELTQRFRASERNYHIAAVMGKSESWVSRGRDRLLCNGVDLTPPACIPSAPRDVLNPTRKVSIRYRDGIAVSLPYLRCLDPEAARG